MFWGLLGPETSQSGRRTRTLGIGAAVRTLNDLSVPGLGGVWFGKQLLLATLGIAVAARARAKNHKVQNIEAANAIEALACWQSYSQNGWAQDLRLRGRLKFNRVNVPDLSFAVVRKRTFYVIQPMRMGTIQPLLALGLVKSDTERFNSFVCSDVGESFIETSCSSFTPYNRSILEHLVGWACGYHNDVQNSDRLRAALSPLDPLPKVAREFLRERLVVGNGRDGLRRRSALKWVRSIRSNQGVSMSWSQRPPSIDVDHWRDLELGALFFKTRDAAIAVLDKLESLVGNRPDQKIHLSQLVVSELTYELGELKKWAQAFQRYGYDPTPDGIALAFCRECTNADVLQVIQYLVARDERVLRLRAGAIRPAAAFQGGNANQRVDEEDDHLDLDGGIRWPEGISYRIKYLFRLNADLDGKLGSILTPEEDGDGQE